MEPDRWAEERRRGMTIDLGYAWLTLPAGEGGPAGGGGPAGEKLAFVDVPGHERFVPEHAGRPWLRSPPSLFVVGGRRAAGCLSPPSTCAAVGRTGVRHGGTRRHLAPTWRTPAPSTRSTPWPRSRRRASGTVEATVVSAVTGQGTSRPPPRSLLARPGVSGLLSLSRRSWPGQPTGGRCGSGSTARSPSGASAPSSPARCPPGACGTARSCCSPPR